MFKIRDDFPVQTALFSALYMSFYIKICLSLFRPIRRFGCFWDIQALDAEWRKLGKPNKLKIVEEDRMLCKQKINMCNDWMMQNQCVAIYPMRSSWVQKVNRVFCHRNWINLSIWYFHESSLCLSRSGDETFHTSCLIWIIRLLTKSFSQSFVCNVSLLLFENVLLLSVVFWTFILSQNIDYWAVSNDVLSPFKFTLRGIKMKQNSLFMTVLDRYVNYLKINYWEWQTNFEKKKFFQHHFQSDFWINDAFHWIFF